MFQHLNLLTFVPLPLHVEHFFAEPALPPRPSHPLHIFCSRFTSTGITALPLYSCSNVTVCCCTSGLGFRGAECPMPPIPPIPPNNPPNIRPKKSSADESPPSCSPFKPYRSYVARFSGSDRTSYANEISLNLSPASGFLSG